MTDLIQAPWTDDEVAALNRFQSSHNVHPFTCHGNRSDEAHREYALKNDTDRGQLVAIKEGWMCPICSIQGNPHKQDWAHAFMLQAIPEMPWHRKPAQ